MSSAAGRNDDLAFSVLAEMDVVVVVDVVVLSVVAEVDVGVLG